VVPGEDTARVLGQELQQLEFLEGQVEHPAAEPGGVRGLVDREVAGPDLVRGVRGGVLGPAAYGQADPGLDFRVRLRADFPHVASCVSPGRFVRLFSSTVIKSNFLRFCEVCY
jgi:hypothetical protein